MLFRSGEDKSLSIEEAFMLHFAELVRLLTRAGIMPRPDVILKLYSTDAPQSVDDLRSSDDEDE